MSVDTYRDLVGQFNNGVSKWRSFLKSESAALNNAVLVVGTLCHVLYAIGKVIEDMRLRLTQQSKLSFKDRIELAHTLRNNTLAIPVELLFSHNCHFNSVVIDTLDKELWTCYLHVDRSTKYSMTLCCSVALFNQDDELILANKSEKSLLKWTDASWRYVSMSSVLASATAFVSHAWGLVIDTFLWNLSRCLRNEDTEEKLEESVKFMDLLLISFAHVFQGFHVHTALAGLDYVLKKVSNVQAGQVDLGLRFENWSVSCTSERDSLLFISIRPLECLQDIKSVDEFILPIATHPCTWMFSAEPMPLLCNHGTCKLPFALPKIINNTPNMSLNWQSGIRACQIHAFPQTGSTSKEMEKELGHSDSRC